MTFTFTDPKGFTTEIYDEAKKAVLAGPAEVVRYPKSRLSRKEQAEWLRIVNIVVRQMAKDKANAQ